MPHQPSTHVQPSTGFYVTVVDRDGFDIEDIDVEAAWLPKLGPTAFLLGRLLVRGGNRHYVLGSLADGLGVGYRKIDAAIDRLDRYGPVDRFHDEVVVPRRWPLP